MTAAFELTSCFIRFGLKRQNDKNPTKKKKKIPEAIPKSALEWVRNSNLASCAVCVPVAVQSFWVENDVETCFRTALNGTLEKKEESLSIGDRIASPKSCCHLKLKI